MSYFTLRIIHYFDGNNKGPLSDGGALAGWGDYRRGPSAVSLEVVQAIALTARAERTQPVEWKLAVGHFEEGGKRQIAALALDRKKLAAFSVLGGGFLRFPIGRLRTKFAPRPPCAPPRARGGFCTKKPRRYMYSLGSKSPLACLPRLYHSFLFLGGGTRYRAPLVAIWCGFLAFLALGTTRLRINHLVVQRL